jgi:hypothetical protein
MKRYNPKRPLSPQNHPRRRNPRREWLAEAQAAMRTRNEALQAVYQMPRDALFRERFFALCRDCGWSEDRTQEAFFAIAFGPWIKDIRHDLRTLDYLRREFGGELPFNLDEPRERERGSGHQQSHAS